MDWPVVYKNYFKSEPDVQLGKIAKKRRLNPTGENVYLCPTCKRIDRDEDKIIAAQRIWRHEYYKPDGKGFQNAQNDYIRSLS